ncbi:hypothetical protein FisN_27Lh116 [Fistulifera solaris]|uniref:Uncharacterized protein n=1 Tax=Fistulifera solaris TaxID=1519565 RepID=A0A1Z5KAQ1_FISSO|nr:hypothetical protein FisN_27Lh116 [Fistulifera solaris]|eukprot:GAX23340.1 hypothetical protein FisN_27Lh116 [Fistulifera solaris]
MSSRDEPLHSAGHVHAPLHNSDDSVGSYPVDTEMNIDDLLSLGSSSFDMRLTNPVQMELQENARLPTFYGTVDRSGSSSIGISRRVPEAALHSPTRLQQQQRQHSDSTDDPAINWGELFLNDRHRVSYHGNYKEAGVLKDNVDTFPMIVPTEVERTAALSETIDINQNTYNDPNDLIIEVEPTPLSEIKRRAEERHHREQKHNVGVNEGPRHHPFSRSTPLLAYDQHHGNSDAVSMAHAIATAAALASTTMQHRPSTSTGMSKLPPATAGVLKDISTKKKKHGFGPNHIVPSVPETDTRRMSRKRPPPVVTTNTNTGKSHNAFVPMAPPFASVVTTNHHNSANYHIGGSEMNDADRGSPTNPGDAYERKKQRAKDARVKLNESIDRMHISIRLALTQSQQRLKQTHESDMLTTAQKEKIGPLMQQTIRIAETAKKWDRPSFVGSAADLIQILNAQCEALMVLAMKSSNHESENSANWNSNAMNAIPASSAISPSNNGQHKRLIIDEAGPLNNSVGDVGAININSNSNFKRVRTTPMTEPQTILDVKDDGSWISNGRILHCIASFLDPSSLYCCHFRICKAWMTLGIFNSDATWERLVLQRFGYYCVRQWRDKLQLDDTSDYPSYATLYKRMDMANAMPHIASVHQNEGWFLLGETRLPGSISAWVYLIERSNGETLRSVHHALTNKFRSLPIVELRTVLQSTGGKEIVWKLDQIQSVDTSTRRRAEEMKELQGDDGRFAKRVFRLEDGALFPISTDTNGSLRLNLFETVIVVSYIHATHCNTISKFVQKSNFTRWLVQVNGTTVPLVIPFPRDALSLQH